MILDSNGSKAGNQAHLEHVKIYMQVNKCKKLLHYKWHQGGGGGAHPCVQTGVYRYHLLKRALEFPCLLSIPQYVSAVQ